MVSVDVSVASVEDAVEDTVEDPEDAASEDTGEEASGDSVSEAGVWARAPSSPVSCDASRGASVASVDAAPEASEASLEASGASCLSVEAAPTSSPLRSRSPPSAGVSAKVSRAPLVAAAPTRSASVVLFPSEASREGVSSVPSSSIRSSKALRSDTRSSDVSAADASAAEVSAEASTVSAALCVWAEFSEFADSRLEPPRPKMRLAAPRAAVPIAVAASTALSARV